MDRERIEKAIGGVEHLYPSLPVLSRLTRLLRRENVDLDEISGLIRVDEALATDIIRISNTATYRGALKCTDIDTALFVIGQNRALEAVSLSVARNVFNRDLVHYGISATEHFDNCLKAGALMERMSRAVGIDKDKAYTAGILRTIGMSVINRIMDDLAIDGIWDKAIAQTEWEKGVTGYDFTSVGARVLRGWDFPSDLVEIIQYQLDPQSAPENSQHVQCIHFTITLLDRTGWNLDAGDDPRLDGDSLGYLERNNIGEGELRVIIDQAREQVMRMSCIF